MINKHKTHCCMINKNYCWHHVLLRCEKVLHSQSFVSLFLFHAYSGQELAIHMGGDPLTNCKATNQSLFCTWTVRKSLTNVSLQILLSRLTKTRYRWHLSTKKKKPRNADKRFQLECTKVFWKKNEQNFPRCSKDMERKECWAIKKDWDT